MNWKNPNFSGLAPYTPTVVRVILGAMFLTAGLRKLFVMKATGVAGFFGTLGIPMPEVMAWAVIFSEVVFGAAVLVGFKTRYAVWPLAGIMITAALLTAWKPFLAGNTSGFFFHILAAAVLIDLAARGPGKYSVDKK